MKKSYILFIGIFFMIILGNALVSAICCEKLNADGKWCQIAEKTSDCDLKYRYWYKTTCVGNNEESTVPECGGTCVDKETGECSYSSEAECKESDGTWNRKKPEELEACKLICCVVGKDAWLLNPTACNDLFTEKNIKMEEGNIKWNINTRAECEEFQVSLETGACVITTSSNKKYCRITTKNDCDRDNLDELLEAMKISPLASQVSDTRFWKERLCTATVSTNEGIFQISDCVKTEETECKDNKVYYKDNCGNFANVYDSDKYNTADYWNYIKDPYVSGEVCSVTSLGSSKCGNCDPSTNTVCQGYEEAKNSNKPQHNLGGLICGDMSCKYKDKNGKTKIYENGESWCEGTVKGTFVIERDPVTGKITPENLTSLKNFNEYNIPGSRYYKLRCDFGEINVEECGDYRNSVCMQTTDKSGGVETTLASCVANPWRLCLFADTKTQCESEGTSFLCKWIPGYRFDYAIVPENERKERQGSCVPLIAPGFDFWKPLSQGNTICGMGLAQESVMFETNWRKQMSSSSATDYQLLANQCLNGCYAIPSYGKAYKQTAGEEKQYPEDLKCKDAEGDYGTDTTCTAYEKLTEFYDESEYHLSPSGSSESKSLVNGYLSIRRGQYCHKDGKPDQWVTGGVDTIGGTGECGSGDCYDCTPQGGSETKDEEKERDYPIYLTNDEWFNSIIERARSLGDCGYKISINGKYSKPEKEMITVIFQKMTQKGEVKEELIVESIIYKGGGKYPLTKDLEKYETVFGTSTANYNCYPDYGGTCVSLAIDPELCTKGGGVINTEATCFENTVCCITTNPLE